MERLDQLTAFRHSLAEAIAWCATRATIADPEWCLRTPTVEPGPLDADLSVSQRQECVARLVQSRSRLLQDAGDPLTPTADLAGGRLLLFDPEETLSDGAAAVASRRFFDDDNVPPWDSWVLYVVDQLRPEQHYFADPLHPAHVSYLVSWVAPGLIPLAHNGILINPENCIEWLADRETPFARTLYELHLLV